MNQHPVAVHRPAIRARLVRRCGGGGRLLFCIVKSRLRDVWSHVSTGMCVTVKRGNDSNPGRIQRAMFRMQSAPPPCRAAGRRERRHGSANKDGARQSRARQSEAEAHAPYSGVGLEGSGSLAKLGCRMEPRCDSREGGSAAPGPAPGKVRRGVVRSYGVKSYAALYSGVTHTPPTPPPPHTAPSATAKQDRAL